jgi:hypothetical protein
VTETGRRRHYFDGSEVSGSDNTEEGAQSTLNSLFDLTFQKKRVLLSCYVTRAAQWTHATSWPLDLNFSVESFYCILKEHSFSFESYMVHLWCGAGALGGRQRLRDISKELKSVSAEPQFLTLEAEIGLRNRRMVKIDDISIGPEE